MRLARRQFPTHISTTDRESHWEYGYIGIGIYLCIPLYHSILFFYWQIFRILISNSWAWSRVWRSYLVFLATSLYSGHVLTPYLLHWGWFLSWRESDTQFGWVRYRIHSVLFLSAYRNQCHQDPLYTRSCRYSRSRDNWWVSLRRDTMPHSSCGACMTQTWWVIKKQAGWYIRHYSPWSANSSVYLMRTEANWCHEYSSCLLFILVRDW